MSAKRSLAALALAFTLVAPGCTNTKDDFNLLSGSKYVLNSVKSKRAPKTAPPPQALAGAARVALRITKRPLATVRMESVNAAAIFVEIERNGDYLTWAPFGVSERRTITTKHGMITATRGMGFDLMSADVDGVLDLVTRREEGTVNYVQRYLDGNNQTVEAATTCVISQGYPQAVEFGEVSDDTLQMFSSCVAKGRQFIDLFLVNQSGRIVQSRQWVGPKLGFGTMLYLR